MTGLTTDPNMADPDGFYSRLIEIVQSLSTDEALAYSARLTYLLANQIGDADVLAEALEAARKQPRC